MNTPPYLIETHDGQPIESNTPAWLLRRQTGIGASDAPAILGLSRWSSPRDVYLDKIATMITDEATEAMEFGHLMEPVARELFRRRHGNAENDRHTYLGEILPSPGLIRSTKYPHLMASLDAVIREPDGQEVPGQIKNVTVYKKGAWAEAEGGVPDDVRVQVIQEAIVFGADHGWVLPIFGGNHMPEPIRVDADPEFVDWYTAEAESWWSSFVEAHREPPPTLLDDLSDIWLGVMGESVTLDDEGLEAVRRHKELGPLIKAMEAERAAAALVVKTQLGEATEAWDRTDPANPRLAATWRPNKPSAKVWKLDEGLLLSDHPELADLLAGYRFEVDGRKAARPFLSK